MIVFDLECRTGGHRFEGWFASSDDFSAQQQRGLVNCPQCQSANILKAPMAPNLARKGNQVSLAAPAPTPHPAIVPSAAIAAAQIDVPGGANAVGGSRVLPPEAAAMMQAVIRMQAEALKRSHWVGDTFANDARAMHYGEKDRALIHGQTTPQEARELVEEGIEIAPILFPLVPPGNVN